MPKATMTIATCPRSLPLRCEDRGGTSVGPTQGLQTAQAAVRLRIAFQPLRQAAKATVRPGAHRPPCDRQLNLQPRDHEDNSAREQQKRGNAAEDAASSPIEKPIVATNSRWRRMKRRGPPASAAGPKRCSEKAARAQAATAAGHRATASTGRRPKARTGWHQFHYAGLTWWTGPGPRSSLGSVSPTERAVSVVPRYATGCLTLARKFPDDRLWLSKSE